jgi:hypothetical protein
MGEKIAITVSTVLRIEEEGNIRKYLKLARKKASVVSRSELFEEISEA